MKTLLLIRTYPIDEFISVLCANSFRSVMDCDVIFFGEPAEYNSIKPFIRPYCCNFGGRDNVIACLEGLKKIDTTGYDKIIFADADITLNRNPLESDYDFGGICSPDNPRHFSGQLLIFSKWLFDYVINYPSYLELFQQFINEGRSIADDTIFSFVATEKTQSTRNFFNYNYWIHKKLHHLEEIDLYHRNEWQYQDSDGMPLPWFAKPALDEILTWDLHDKDVFEYGGGASTLWWNAKAKSVTTVDNNPAYYNAVKKILPECKILLHHDPEDYINEVKGKQYDIIIIDGYYRDECIQPAIASLKQSGKLIFDNYQQPSVHMIHPQLVEILEKMEHKIFFHPSHYDWQTAIFTK